MESLPPELLDHIADHLDVPDPMCLRLTARKWSKAARPGKYKLFNPLHFAPFESCMQTLEAIVETPELAKHIKTFIFHCEMIPDNWKWKTYATELAAD